MVVKKTPGFWALADESEIGAALRGARISLATQDKAFKYTSGLNLPSADGSREIVGLGDDDFYPAVGRDLRACKERVTSTGKGESIDIRVTRGSETEWYRVGIEPLRNGGGGGVLSAAVDVAAQKTAEENLRLAL